MESLHRPAAGSLAGLVDGLPGTLGWGAEPVARLSWCSWLHDGAALRFTNKQEASPLPPCWGCSPVLIACWPRGEGAAQDPQGSFLAEVAGEFWVPPPRWAPHLCAPTCPAGTALETVKVKLRSLPFGKPPRLASPSHHVWLPPPLPPVSSEKGFSRACSKQLSRCLWWESFLPALTFFCLILLPAQHGAQEMFVD